MVGFLVFAVALDLTWTQFQRVLRSPKAPLIGLVAQYLILPSVAFAVGRTTVETPSIALSSTTSCSDICSVAISERSLLISRDWPVASTRRWPVGCVASRELTFGSEGVRGSA
jgi:hypothetical protein